METQQLRKIFTEFFVAKGHTPVPSASLVPHNDPTLLFTNAGMVPFKNVFLGQEDRGYSRATSIQACVRAGGKHNDLENVGYTARHHTFFEMMGNFSFGDYFKREAIQFSWTFLTDILQIPAEKLWITVFEEDNETADIWLTEIGVDKKRFSRIGAKDNFWSMGETGPCGPCTEIFYDHGADIPGGPPGTPEQDGDRYIEIWNMVFMQYNRQADGTMNPLPKPSVDTGMGLERIAAVLQGVHDNYDIDLFQHLIGAAVKVTGTSNCHSQSLRVIADHIRSCAFLIKDGVLPANEGRGYVLRRIIRRAVRHGHQLGAKGAFFYKLVKPLIEVMGVAYQELGDKQAEIEAVLKQEEQQFAKTLDQGIKILEDAMQSISGDKIPGNVVFKLYDTYGFPVDLTADVGREKGLDVDLDGFEKCMAAQRARARSASNFSADLSQTLQINTQTQFIGYDHLSESTQIEALFNDKGESVERLDNGEQGIVVIPISPFYAESGGQVGDCGKITFSDGEFAVDDTQKVGDAIIHHGMVILGSLKLGKLIETHVDAETRQATVLNHSATHLLHAALRKTLGSHVEQKGSLVEPQRLRFDFSHPGAVTLAQLAKIEDCVNQAIRANLKAEIIETDMASAKRLGAMALFGEKYGSQVRVLKFADFSIELCGGCHVNRTGDIGFFKIISETGIAAGIRRIEAVSGQDAIDVARQESQQLSQVAGILKSKPDSVVEKLKQRIVKQKQSDKDVQSLKNRLARSTVKDMCDDAIDIPPAKVLSTEVIDTDVKTLRDMLTELKFKLKTAVIVLGLKHDGKVNLIAGVTDDLTHQVKAGELVNFVAQQVGGKGGGRADMAQAGGTQPENLKTALRSVEKWVWEKLA